MTTLNFSVLIPARRASTRLPDKPLADIAGLPMIVHVAQRALRSGANHVIVATDDAEIARVCAAHAIDAMLTRADHASGTDRIAEAALHLGLAATDVVVNVQGDEPLIDPALIRACAQHLVDDPQAAIATAAHPIHDAADVFNPNVVKVVLDTNAHALLFSRAPIPWRRDAFVAANTLVATPSPPPWPRLPADLPFLRHVGIYGYRMQTLQEFAGLPPCPLEQAEALEQLRALWHGQCVAVMRVDSAPAPGVDTAEDLAHVRRLLQTRP